MTLPEKVRDVTQSEWLEVRERLAAAEAQLALAKAWGAEVCATVERLTAASGVPLSRSELAQWQDDMRVKAWAQTAEAEQRAARAEAERDAMRAALAAAEESADLVLRHEDRARLEADLAAARAQLAAANDQHERTMHYFHEALSFAKPRDSRAQSLLDAIEALRRGHEQRKAFNSIGPRPCDEEEIARLRAQLAAVVAAARRSYRAAGSTCECESDEHVGACRAEIDAAVALRDVLADTAQAAREHDERVRAEERERCAKACEAMVIGGRAWTAEQAKAAEVLLAAAASIRALGSR